jgi:1-acyl-sn-glycerol-3-phosphate acyltransferase
MESWKYDPAHDLGLSERERLRSLRRESGLVGVATRICWWWLVRGYFATGQRITIEGRENLPAAPPFMLVANHCSHLDVLVMATALPLKVRNHVFPIAAGDTFFETPLVSAFAAGMMNALPMWRKNAGRHAMEQLRTRLIGEPCGYILFPEGTRSRTGEMGKFRAGVGMLIAGAPAPVVPCHLEGTFLALPPDRRFPRRASIRLRIGKPLDFHEVANDRDGWDRIATELEAAVRSLARGSGASMEALGGKGGGGAATGITRIDR